MSDPFRFDPMFDDLGSGRDRQDTQREQRLPEPANAWERLKNAPGNIDYAGNRTNRPSPFFTPRTRSETGIYGDPLDSPIDEERTKTIGQKARSAAMGGIRHLASALEPLQLPQDVFFATIEAGIDDDKTLLENLKEIEWAKYAPLGAAPARVTDGSTILKLAGVQDEKTQKWGGLLMDLVVDPLIFGAAARGVGKLSKVEGLTHLGNRMDRAVAPSIWANTAYHRVPQVKKAVDGIVDETLIAMRNPDANLFGALSSQTVNKIADWTLPRRSALRGRFEDAELARRLASAPQTGQQRAQDLVAETYDLSVEMRALMGDELSKTTFRSVFKRLGEIRRAEVDELTGVPTIIQTQMAREGYDFIRQNPAGLTPGVGYTDEVDDLFNVMPDGRRLEGDLRFDPESALGRAAPTAREARMQAARQKAYDDTLARRKSRGDTPEKAQAAAQRAWDRYADVAESPSAVQRSLDNFEESVDAIRETARKNGYGQQAEHFAERYTQFVQKIAAKKAQIGYELSGMGIAKKVIVKRGTEVFGSTEEGLKLWNRVLTESVQEGGLEGFLGRQSGISPRTLTTQGLRNAEYRKRNAARAERNYKDRGYSDEEAAEAAQRAYNRVPEPELDPAGQRLAGERADKAAGTAPGSGVGDASRAKQHEFTWRELLGDEWEGFSSLGVGTYLAGLKNGHMYRTYGIWQTTDDMREWARKIEQGVIIPNNVIDEAYIIDALRKSGFEQESRLVQDYIDASTRNAADRGGMVDSRKLGRHIAESLQQQGVGRVQAGQQARNVLEKIRREASGQLGDRAKQIREEVIPAFEVQNPNPIKTALAPSRFTERTDFTPEQLDILGEMADPLISLMEDAQALNRRIPAMTFMKEVYDEGLRGGAIKRAPFTDEMGVTYQRVLKESGVATPFEGKWIHPQLMAEMRKVQGKMDFTPSRLGHLRSLITGGYLAAPNILAANLAGGLLSAWEAGVAPHRMLRAMVETFPELHKKGGRDYLPLKELRAREAISVQNLSMQDIGRTTRHFKLSQAALEPQGLRKAGQEIQEWYEWILQGGPRATRWAGLSGFQFTERWMKTSIYKAMKDAGRTTNDAAELARIGVFDYSELPEALAFGRDMGVLLFPGFPYFMTGRTLRATMDRPGIPALADRAAEAVSQAFANDEQEQLAMWTNMPDWLKADQGVPIARFQDANDDTRMSFIPLNQLLPTNTFGGNPFAESLATGGLYRPFMEAIYAHLEGTGEAVFSSRFGQEVFSPEQNFAERSQATMSFLFNNLAPSAIRKAYSPNPGTGRTGEFDPIRNAGGVLPRLVLPKELVNDLYTYDEQTKLRAERSLRDEVTGAVLRAARPIAQEGPLIGIRNEYRGAQREHGLTVASLRDRIKKARASGQDRLADKLTRDLQRKEQEFRAKWSEWLGIAQEPEWGQQPRGQP